MNWLSLSLLLVACAIPLTSVSASSAVLNDDHATIIARHLTTFSHSFGILQTSAPTSQVFGPVNGASAACKASSVLLETNSTILAANATVIASGCTDPDKQTCAGTSPRTCTCIATYSNDANVRSLVTQSGGRVCSVNMQLTATANNGQKIDFNFQGIGGLAMIGSACNDQDLQAALTWAMDMMAQGIRESQSSSSSSVKVQTITGTLSFCGTSYTGTRNDAYNKKPIAIIIASLIGIIITIINVAL